MRPQKRIHKLTQKNIETILNTENLSFHKRTLGERIADDLTLWVGSWTFVITQTALLFIWLILNIKGVWQPWDPYPFVLLNLVLSFQAAFATPIILMSENRQARISEQRNHLDLQINLLTEQESTKQLKMLRQLCEKAGIRLEDVNEQAMEETTDPTSILQEIISRSANLNRHQK